MLIAKKINHQNVIFGKIFVSPLIDKIFRVWNFEYVIFTSKNNAEEDSPCATIIIILPLNPRRVIVNNEVSTMPIWAIDE